MKKIYIPTNKELYQMQEMKCNIYKYLFIKAIESLTLEGVKYPYKGILKTSYQYIKENPDIAQAICRLYPNEIKYSEIAKYDNDLCRYLIAKENDDSIYNLDNLSHFSDATLYSWDIINNVVNILSNKLIKTPQYRFEYKDNPLLDNIFNCNLSKQYISKYLASELKDIEPAYILKLDKDLFSSFIPHGMDESYLLKQGIEEYAKRYGIREDLGKEYIGHDILTNPEQDVKRLIKCIKTQ